jgi:CelD/BcsL family acetyltransferase involved in cellulose biosynthesis
MRVTVIRPEELGPSEAEQWQKFQQLSPIASHPFLSLTYAKAADRTESNARVAIVVEDGNIKAFIPHEVGKNRIAMPIGGSLNGLDGLVSSNDPLDLRSVIRKAGIHGWRFFHAPEEQIALAPYRYHHNYHSTTISVIDLAEGYDAYINGMTEGVVSRMSRTARYRRALERKMGSVTLEWNNPSPDHLRRLLAWKFNQYDDVRKLFSDPASFEFVQELAATQNEDCSGVTSVLWAGERPIVVLLSLRSRQTLAPWFTAYDPEFARYSPGTIKWFAVAEGAARHGITRIDFGYGTDSYKRRLGNVSYTAGGGGVWASRLEAAGRSIYRRLRFRNEAS